MPVVYSFIVVVVGGGTCSCSVWEKVQPWFGEVRWGRTELVEIADERGLVGGYNLRFTGERNHACLRNGKVVI